MLGRCLRFLVVVLLAVGSAAAQPVGPGAASKPPAAVASTRPSPWTTVAVIPWGKGAGRLLHDMDSSDPRVVYRGPTRVVAVPGGGFAVLDTLEPAIEEFDARGRPVRAMALPPQDENDADTIPADLARCDNGDYWVLCVGPRRLLRVGPGGIKERREVPGLGPRSLPARLCVDPSGRILVLDAFDTGVVGYDGAGKPVARQANEAAYGMVLDGEGRFLWARLPRSGRTRELQLVKWLPGQDAKPFGTLRFGREVSRYDPFGVDGSGNLYLTVECGTADHVAQSWVVRVSADGRESGRVRCPLDPVRILFVHGKAVSPDGVVLAVEPVAAGLRVLRLVRF